MLLLEIIITVLVAIIIGALFYYVFKYAGPWGSFLTFILVLILAGLAAEAWIEPFGPVYWDVAWVPTVFIILLFALLLAAATPPGTRRSRLETSEEVPPETSRGEAAYVAIGGFFWIFLIFLLIAAIWGIFV